MSAPAQFKRLEIESADQKRRIAFQFWMMKVQVSAAVTIALAPIDAWNCHDWDKTKEPLAPDVHAWVHAAQFARAVEFTAVDEYMARKVKGAQLVEHGSVQVMAAFGDERNPLILVLSESIRSKRDDGDHGESLPLLAG